MIVLIHGFTGSPESFATLRPLLRGDVRTPALLGHGVLDPTVTSFVDEVDRLARDIRAAAGHDRPIVVGYSLGGRLALGLAARHPDLPRAVVAIGAHPGLCDPRERVERRRSDEALAARIESIGVRRFAAEWEALPLFASQKTLPPSVLERQRAIRSSHDAAGLSHSLRTLGLGVMPDLRAGLVRSPVAVHLVTGALDERFTTIAAELGRLRPVVRTVVAAAGHNVLLERPERVATAILSSLGIAPDEDVLGAPP